MQLYLVPAEREALPPDLLNPPAWVGYLLEGYSTPVARLLATRDALVECGRYVRQGRSRELVKLLGVKLRRRLRRVKIRLRCDHAPTKGRIPKRFDVDGRLAGYHECCANCGLLLRTKSYKCYR